MNTALQDILDGGWIERFHLKGQRMLTRQSVAEHSWRIAAILYDLWPTCRPELIWAALFHDVSERVTGDVPSPVKRLAPTVAEAVHKVSTEEEIRLNIRFTLSLEEEKILGWLDRFEGALHCCDELEMGNRKVIGALERYLMYADVPWYVLADPGQETRRKRLQTELCRRVQALINHEDFQ